jgi:hypothetical protein
MAGELAGDRFRRVALGIVVDLHRAARQAEHGQRNGGEGEVVIQHHAEEARDQDLERQGGASQHENRKVVAA